MIPRLFPQRILAAFLLLAAAGNVFSGPSLPPEQFSRPVITADGTCTFVFKSSDGRLFLRKSGPSGTAAETLLSPLAGAIFSPGLVADRADRLWIFGEDWSNRRNTVFLARLDNGVVNERSGFLQPSGHNRAPDVAFDGGNSPWIAWTARDGEAEKIFCADILGRKTWTVAAGAGLIVAHPRLISDQSGQLWIFWAGAWRGQRGVYYSNFDGLRWSAAQQAGGHADFPCLDAEPAVDGWGRLWLAWSGYNGQNYGIDYAVWNGRVWSPTRRIDGGSTGTARAPRLAFTAGSEPLAVWDEAGEEGHRTVASLYKNGTWSGPAALGAGVGEGDFPKIATTAGGIAVVGLGGRADGAAFIESSKLADLSAGRRESPVSLTGPHRKYAPNILFNPLLDETKYIGFGDSITYGYMDYEEAPEKGYIPRLQTLLSQNFGATIVFNDGLGGETTPYGASRIDKVISNRQARYLLLLEGTNDVKLLEIPIDTTIFDLAEMLRKCLAAGVFPAVCTLLPRRDWISYYTLYTDRFDEVNRNIPLIAAEKGVPMLDLFKVFDEYPDGGPDALLSTDLVHPNELGYQVMAEQWLKAIRAYPFPPAQIQIRKDTDKILFFHKPGNMLSWITSPKIADASIIRSVKIYRRKRGEGADKFGLLATVLTGTLSYFDATITVGTTYEYVLVSVRNDGIEGPASDLVII